MGKFNRKIDKKIKAVCTKWRIEIGTCSGMQGLFLFFEFMTKVHLIVFPA